MSPDEGKTPKVKVEEAVMSLQTPYINPPCVCFPVHAGKSSSLHQTPDRKMLVQRNV